MTRSTDFVYPGLAAALFTTALDAILSLASFDGKLAWRDFFELPGRADLLNLVFSLLVFSLITAMAACIARWVDPTRDRLWRTIASRLLVPALVVIPVLITVGWGEYLRFVFNRKSLEFPDVPVFAGVSILISAMLLYTAFVLWLLSIRMKMESRIARFAFPILVLCSGIAMLLSFLWVRDLPVSWKGVALLLVAAYVLLILGWHGIFRVFPVPASSRSIFRAGILALHGLLLIIGLAASGNRSARLLHEWTAWTGEEANLADFWLDLDQDGYRGSWAGGPDCNDQDPRINPDGRERVKNGADDNCMLGDASKRWTGRLQRSANPAPLRKIVLLSLDALRADALCVDKPGSVCAARSLSRFLARGVSYSRAYSPSNFTDHSMATLMTGLFVTGMRQWSPAKRHYTVDLPFSLPVMLKAAGIFTAVATTIDLPQPVESAWSERLVDDHPGLSEMLTPKNTLETPVLTTLAMDFLLRHNAPEERYLLWVHTFDTHAPYRKVRRDGPGLSSGEGAYLDAVRYTDNALAPLLTLLSDPRNGDVGVVVFSDHGEELGRRPGHGHGSYLYDTSVRVPLGVAGPGIPSGIVTRPVSLVDLVPTVLHLFGLPLDPRLHGAPLPSLRSAGEDRPIFLEMRSFASRTKFALIQGRHKIIRDLIKNYFEIYDLEGDPEERHDLADERPDLLKPLSDALSRFVEERFAE